MIVSTPPDARFRNFREELLRDALTAAVFSSRAARDEDLRALTLEHEERAALGHGAVTEADILPGS